MSEIEFRKRFGKAVATRRQIKGLSQEQLAEVVGVSRNEVSLVERGEVTCSLWVAASMAAALQTSVGELVAAVDVPRSPEQLRLAEVVERIPAGEADRAASLLALALGPSLARPRGAPHAGSRLYPRRREK